jgi:hypothetical protein
MGATKHSYANVGGSGGADFVPVREVFHLKKLFSENRGSFDGDGNYIVPFHGEVTAKSLREWSLKHICLWRGKGQAAHDSVVDFDNVSRDKDSGLAYQVDFSVSAAGKTENFVLRINEASHDMFVITIQRKSSPSSLPLGLNAAPIVWSRTGKVSPLF